MALKNITKLFTSTPSMASTESSDFIKGQRAQEMDDFTYGFPPHEASRPQRDSVQRWKSTSLVLLKCVGVFLLGAFSAVGYASLKKDGGSWSVCPNDRKPFVYSPANHLGAYDQEIWFERGLQPNLTFYQGQPTLEREEAWQNLYDKVGMSKIPKSEAAKLAYKSLPIPGDPENYAVALSVFHDLHCLNSLRRHFWATELRAYGRDVEAEFGHLYHYDHELTHMDHCIDAIRASLMCNADISPVGWRWDEEAQKMDPLSHVPHTCRDFGAIWDWAKENRSPAFDRTIRPIEVDS